ncbi:MAG: xanthine dehydrogenase accessory protein XdhC [Pirellulaceae bacterium]|nr:xanthine dehydrogenase accessory protein XdhC [Pirellulaceae bacterium]
MTHNIVDHHRLVQKLLDQGESFAAVTLVEIRGSAPQIVGAKCVVTRSGIEGGTVGGGKIEAAAIDYAQQLLASGQQHAELVTWNLQTEIGMTCGGEVKLFFDVYANAAWPIVIFGAGHIAQALVRLLLNLDCRVTCIDTRSDWLSRLPDDNKLMKICVDTPRDLVAQQPANAYFVLMSKGHATDLPVLHEILATRNAPYVGVIGSPQKASVLRRDLNSLGLAPDKIKSFHCPVGLPIGNNTPAEIAISIAAQLLQHRDGNADA